MGREIAPLGGAVDLADGLDSAKTYARNEKAENTRRAYRSALAAFVEWCAARNASSLPAAPGTVAAYLAGLADQGRKVSTIQIHAAAIGHAHRLSGLASPLSDEGVKATLRGIRRTIGVAAQGKRPLTAELIAKVLRKLPDTLAGKRDRALIALGFAAALRRSEIVGLTIGQIERTPKGLFVHLGKTKTDQEGRGAVIAVPKGRKIRPVQALEAWIDAAQIREGALFRRVTGPERVGGALSDRAAAEIVKRAVENAGFDVNAFSGHSLRSGFVTSALDEGVDLFRVMDVTRHKRMETLRIYDRRSKAFDGHAGKDFL
jgi:site-specific recombinase XerD